MSDTKTTFNFRDSEQRMAFEETMAKCNATQTKVLNALIDAYIEADGSIPFPVKLAPHDSKMPKGKR